MLVSVIPNHIHHTQNSETALFIVLVESVGGFIYLYIHMVTHVR